MEKENIGTANGGELTSRITRSRAAALSVSHKIPLVKAPTQVARKLPSRKRAALDEKSNNVCLPCKKRAVLQDVTNVNSTKHTQTRTAPSKLPPSVAVSTAQPQTRPQVEVFQGQVKLEPKSEDITRDTKLEEKVPLQLGAKNECEKEDCQLNTSGLPSQPHSPPKRESKGGVFGHLAESSNPDVTDIDSDQKNHLLCSLYASDIYNNLRVAELVRRPYSDFMETIQRDITQGMRGILVDWLVEVSEEYKLVPDTLYLTVYLIDTFLAQNYIERQKLQLLGITCMLIASKYEEICAPRVEEFCFITDNTYSREEVLDICLKMVLKMESEVLKYFGFQIFTPTVKTFLRRFLRAAQASYKSPCVELEYLANYLAELTLMNYGFLNYLPSVIAASAVFLARWTLDQSSHPWNPTLEHYTSYKASDLQTSVQSLQDLQLNTKGCPLDAIRMKYRQQKFKSGNFDVPETAGDTILKLGL